MAEYIERKILKSEMTEAMCGTGYQQWAIDVIDRLPAADVIEVVRCKDCKNRYVPCRCALWYGTVNETEYFIERGDDFFCSYAEKKEGAENDL